MPSDIIDRALKRSREEEVEGVPSYMVVADSTNIANRNMSFVDSAAQVIDNVPKFIGTSVIAGLNNLANIPTDIGNLFGLEAERSVTSEVIEDFDSDLGRFYAENTEGVDLAGFILSSFVPGLGGIKVLNMGQASLRHTISTGRFGTNTGKALGLLAPTRQKHLDKAIKEIVNSNSTPSLINREALKAVGAGFSQNVLEGAAFEVAVAASLFNSPILEDQSFGDLMSNIAFGAVVFGGIGGVVDATKAAFQLKRAVNAADEFSKPWTTVLQYGSASQTYERIALDFEQLELIPAIPAELGKARTDFLATEAGKKRVTLEGQIRSDIGKLANGDQNVATALFQAFKRQNPTAQKEAFIGLDEVSRLSEVPKIEKKLRQLEKIISKPNPPEEAILAYSNLSRGYARAWGHRAGVVTKEVPVSTSIIDLVRAGKELEVTSKHVKAGDHRWYFDLKYNLSKGVKKHTGLPWNILEADPYTANARYVWASRLNKFEPTIAKPIRIGEGDLPLLEKAFLELDKRELQYIDIMKEDGLIVKASEINFQDFLGVKKAELANRLLRATNEGAIGSDPIVVANRLRAMLGIRFAVQDLPAGTRAQAKYNKVTASQTIEVDRKALTTEPLHRLVSSILHEEGHLKFDTILDIGGVPPSELAALKAELVAASKKSRADSWKEFEKLGGPDITSQRSVEYWEYLNDMHELMADTFSFFSQFSSRMANEAPVFNRLYGHLVRPLPKELVDSYTKRATALDMEEIAAMVNVKPSMLEGVLAKDSVNEFALSDILAMQSYAEEYTKKLIESGERRAVDGIIDIWNIPQTLKMTYDSTPFEGLNGFVVENMTRLKETQALYQAATANAAKISLGSAIYDMLPDITTDMILRLANRSGAGSGFASSANGNYGTLDSFVGYIGNVTSRAIEKQKEAARAVLDPLLYKLANKQEAAIEWSVLNQRLRSMEEVFGVSPDGRYLEPMKLIRWRAAAEEAAEAGKGAPARPTLSQVDTPERIVITNDEVFQLMKAHVKLNGNRTNNLNTIRSAQGVKYQRDPDGIYPIPVDPSDYPHFALVTDDSVTAVGHHTTLFARSAEELAEQISKLQGNPHLTIRTKGEAEQYFKNIGQFDYEKTLSDNYLDTTARRRGVSAPYIVSTDPTKIVADAMNWHMARETGMVRESILAKYEVQFAELEALGKSFTNIATSKFSKQFSSRFSDDVVSNPYTDYVKTALAVKKNAEYPVWVQPNRWADEQVSKLLRKVSGAVESARTEEELLAVNAMLEKGGYKGAHYDAGMELFANALPDRGVLINAIQKANNIMATVVLRWDTLNAVNNAVSANVLLGAELKAVIRAIEAGDEEAAGALALLTKIKVPGTDKYIFAPQKLIQNAILKFNRNSAEMAFYKEHGYITNISDQYRSTLDDLAFNGKDIRAYDKRINGVHQKLREAADTGEKWTGNRLAEEFNRFVAADVMKQLTDVAVTRGLMTAKEQLAYINTFVNRTQGNYLASQRPMLFQGAIGQAIGLFQTYQFNLMQQLLRHVGEGHVKDSMTLLALQGTIHGMNGLPGFNAINTHIIGTASGNTEHKDAYSALYGVAGKEAGDWLMYGVASNAFGIIDPDLKINLYTRGDINPRHVTLVPTDPASVPIVQASAKVFANLFETIGKLGAGGDPAATILQGLEHNGLSRPLAGLAQTIQGVANPEQASYSTSKRGNVVASNDLLSLANLGRMVGGKPLDEAIALDATFRYKAYALKDADRRDALGETIKTTMIAGNNPTKEQIESFAEKYAATGGRIHEFNKWMTQLYKTANTSQANSLQQSLSSPFSQSMQTIMGGRELRDFTE